MWLLVTRRLRTNATCDSVRPRSQVFALVLLLATTSAQAALLGRAPSTPGSTDYQAYYDDVQDITWLADANYAKTSGYDYDGTMTWSSAHAWIDSLNASSHLGQSGWRLPLIVDKAVPGCNFGLSGRDCGYNVDIRTGEMAHLYYSTLGNVAIVDANDIPTGCDTYPPYCLSNTGPFANLEATYYWSSATYVLNADDAWIFQTFNGAQSHTDKRINILAWAVHSGDIGVVPLPPALWLFGSALGVMAAMSRKSDSRLRP